MVALILIRILNVLYASSPSSGLGELGYLSAQHRSKYLWWTGRSTQGFGTLGLNKRTIGHTWLVNPFLARSILKGTGTPTCTAPKEIECEALKKLEAQGVGERKLKFLFAWKT
jgi:hypothetical protein